MRHATEFERQEVKRLITLMRDPRYWRDKDPEVRRTVHTGFKRLYGRHPRDPGGRSMAAQATG